MNRRDLLASSLGTGLSLLGEPARAAVPGEILSIERPAVRARLPAGAFLVAITRAADRLIAVGEQGLIIFSDDNGLTWLQADVPVQVNLTCVAFATPMIGWAAGHFGIILKTADKGQTWNVQLDGDQVNAMALAAAQNPALQNGTLPAAPLALKRAEIFIRQGPSMPFLSLMPLGPDKALAFGAYRMAEFTTDGGLSWADWTLNIGDRVSHNLYATAKTGDRIYVAGEAGAIFCSTDDGATFPALPPPSGSTLYGVLIAKDGSIIVFGVAGGVFRSADNGNSWNPINLGTQDTLTAGRVMSSGTILIAGEAGALYASKDNGVTFALASGGPSMAIFDLQEAANGDTVFVGNAGAVAVTTHF